MVTDFELEMHARALRKRVSIALFLGCITGFSVVADIGTTAALLVNATVWLLAGAVAAGDLRDLRGRLRDRQERGERHVAVVSIVRAVRAAEDGEN